MSDRMTDVYSDRYWQTEFAVTQADMDRLESYIVETGTAYDSTNPLNPEDRDIDPNDPKTKNWSFGTLFDHNPRNYGPPRNIIFRVALSF